MLAFGDEAVIHGLIPVDLDGKLKSYCKVASYPKVHPGPPSSSRSAKFGGGGGKPIETFI